MLTTCPQCARAVEPCGPAGAEVTHGTVRGFREGPRTWACPEGHTTVAVDVAAGIAEVVAGFDVARAPRLRRGLRCGACDAALVLPGRRATRVVTVTDAGAPALRLRFDVPLLRCTEDAVENLPAACLEDLRQVVRLLLGEPDTSGAG